MVLFDEHFFPLFSLTSQRKNILTNQMKNEYFQENLEKRIKITREMILSNDPNEIRDRKSKSKGKWLKFEERKSIKNPKKMTFFVDENTKLRIIWIYKGNGIKNRTWIRCQNHEEIDSFSQIKRKYWRKSFECTM